MTQVVKPCALQFSPVYNRAPDVCLEHVRIDEPVAVSREYESGIRVAYLEVGEEFHHAFGCRDAAQRFASLRNPRTLGPRQETGEVPCARIVSGCAVIRQQSNVSLASGQQNDRILDALGSRKSIGPYEIAAPVRAGGMGEVHWPNPESKTKVHRRMRLGSGATRSLVKCLAESLLSQILHSHGTSHDFWLAKNRMVL